MINLLPPEAKKDLKEEENWKLYITLSFLILVFFISFSLILFSVKNFIGGESESQKILLEQRENEFKSPQRHNLQINLMNFNNSFIQIDKFYKEQFSSAELLAKISSIVPAGIRFTNLSISKSEGKAEEINCSISGFSPDRDTLLSFKENLEKEENFGEINLPPSNWVKPVDINFTINFKIK
ncbi:MAG: PilN domain-containing protein [bacterium]